MTLKEFGRKIFSRIVMLNCLGMIVVTLLLGLATIYALDFYTRHGEDITMPDLYGQDIDVATKKLEALGLEAVVVGKAYRETLPEGAVVIQSVAHGQTVKAGRKVEVYINTLNPMMAIPDGIAGNCALMEAEAILTNLGFKLTAPEYVVGDNRDWVIEIKVRGKVVAPGTEVSVKTPLTLVVSDGSTEEVYNGNDSLYNEVFDELEWDSTYNEEPVREETEAFE